MQVELLEDRRLLTVTTAWVDDNWFDLDAAFSRGDQTLLPGDLVVSGEGIITATYGVNAFGKVANTDNSSLPGSGLIHDAIQHLAQNGQPTLNILRGTFVESDIVIDRPLSLIGAGQSGTVGTVIVPEATSARGEANFPTGSHQGIIIDTAQASVSQLTLDGSGNVGVAGSNAYHQGITTMYDQQAGGDYGSLHNGPLSVGPASNLPGITVTNVTVKNVYWHGITVSGPSGVSDTAADVENCTVIGVNAGGTQNVDRIGILMQNVTYGRLNLNSVTNAGVGIATSTFGTTSFGSDNAARNRVSLTNNSVSNPVVRGFSLTNADSEPFANLDFLPGMAYNTATTNDPASQAIGIYLDHSQITITAGGTTNFPIGLKVVNTTFADGVFPMVVSTQFVGPAVSAPNSIGVLATGGSIVGQSIVPGPSASVILSTDVKINSFGTGVRAEQFGTSTDGQLSTVELSRARLNGNTVGASAGSGGQIVGGGANGIPVIDSLNVSSGGTIAPGYPFSASTVKSTNPTVVRPPDHDQLLFGNVTLNPGSTFAPVLSGSFNDKFIANFSSPQTYPFDMNPFGFFDGQTVEPYFTNFANGVVQDGTGSLRIFQQAGGNHSIVVGTFNHDSGTQLSGFEVYDLAPIDISNQTSVFFNARILSGNQAQQFLIGLVDIEGHIALWPISFSELNTSSDTSVWVNLSAPRLNLIVPGMSNSQLPFAPPGQLDLSHIVGYAVGSDSHITMSNVPFALSVSGMQATNYLGNVGALRASGTVSVSGATLAATLPSDFNPNFDYTDTLINNSGSSPIVGTFAGLPEGGTTTVGGYNFKISYTGGDGNDVVLSRFVPGQLVLNGGPTPETDFQTNWSNSGAVNLTSNTAFTNNSHGIEMSLTATIVGVHPGDILTAIAPQNSGITVDAFNSTTGVLSMHGFGFLDTYNTLLRSLKYDNTLGIPPVSQVTVNIVANDGTTDSNIAVSTVNIAHSTIPNGGRKLFYNNSGTGGAQPRYDGANAAINASDDLAIATDKSAYLPGQGLASFANVSSYTKGINGLMIDMLGPHAATLTASDFIFKTGGVGIAANVNVPSTWVTFTQIPAISIRSGAGVNGSDRVEIVWPDNLAPKKTWLEVIVKANANTGLAQLAGYPDGQGDVFFFGNAIGDSGEGDNTNAMTNGTDEIGARNHPAAAFPLLSITNRYDFNRDGQVNSTDQIIARNNFTANATAIRFINIGSSPSAPEGGGAISLAVEDVGENSALVSALAESSPGTAVSTANHRSGATLPIWLSSRLANVDVHRSETAAWVEESDSRESGSHKPVVEIDKLVDDPLDLDDDLLASLCAARR